MIAELLIVASATASTGYAGAVASPRAEPQAVAERRIRAAHLISLRALARVRMAGIRAVWEMKSVEPAGPDADRALNWELEDHINREEPVAHLVSMIWNHAEKAGAASREIAGRVGKCLPPSAGKAPPIGVTIRPPGCDANDLESLVVCAEAAALASVRAAQSAELAADRAIALGRGVRQGK